LSASAPDRSGRSGAAGTIVDGGALDNGS